MVTINCVFNSGLTKNFNFPTCSIETGSDSSDAEATDEIDNNEAQASAAIEFFVMKFFITYTS
jgi:hypothetical protein